MTQSGKVVHVITVQLCAFGWLCHYLLTTEQYKLFNFIFILRLMFKLYQQCPAYLKLVMSV